MNRVVKLPNSTNFFESCQFKFLGAISSNLKFFMVFIISSKIDVILSQTKP